MWSDQLWIPDLLNGRYCNPVLFSDLSDPDVIGVDGVYYLTASSFNFLPGLPILTSTDLVNWQLRGNALPHLPGNRGPEVPQHARGVWAPAIRYHQGRFYIFFGIPDEGIFRISTKDPLGPWEPPVCLLRGKGLIDPCPFWDVDGKAWVVHAYARSRIGFKSFLGAFPMNTEATRATGPDRLIYNGTVTQPTIEGPKVYRHDGYVFIYAPAGGVEHGWQTVLRAKHVPGPYEERVVMRQGRTEINGPHQGAWVQTPQGEHWFVHFQQRGAYGRVMHLQPMRWKTDGWPIIGTEGGSPDCGEPCMTHAKPKTVLISEPTSLQASDDFAGETLSPQWQFFGEWGQTFFSLTQKPNTLRLFALPVPQGGGAVLWHCPQALTQRTVCPAFTATVTLDAGALGAGSQAGLAVLGGQAAYLAVRTTDEGKQLAYVQSAGEEAPQVERVLAQAPLTQDTEQVQLRLSLSPAADNRVQVTFAACTDGKGFLPMGDGITLTRHTWVGVRPALFAMALHASVEPLGYADFSMYRVVATGEG